MNTKRPRSAYTAEYKAEAIKLYDSGLGLAKTARKLGIANQTLDAWVKKRQQGKTIAATASTLTVEQLENRQLKAALALAVMERDILKKATAYFAKLAP
jgi:transposase